MAKKRFYGVAGSNGYGVYDDYDRVLKTRPFVTEFTIKKFNDFNEAKVFALDGYERLQDGTLGLYDIEDINEKNWFYRRKLIDTSSGKTEYAPGIGTDVKQNIRPFTVGISKDNVSLNIGV